ncbi:hypothetical protein WN982_08420 [Paraburkholderia sp. IMGN_8]|uniref:hypothetical protein n=1 Tax=Paraburkholderia sp. IMGN_8 TaxID=3136564 RepID=UPI0031010923
MAFDAFTLVTAHRISPRGDFTFVLKHALARRERMHGEHAFAVNWRPPNNHAPHTRSFPDVSASIRAANFRIQCDGMSTCLPRPGTGGHIEAGESTYLIRRHPGMTDDRPRRDPASEKLIAQLTQANPLHRAHEGPACGIERFDHRALPAGFRNDAHDARPVTQ